ncbi:hypothetical protein M5V91_11285 [Cytobacillus pseudoceanisediminis]|uniref:hypothetical protein n=1 Tax=Cytobacillus pseudoceanisediminis TaxID=3051614 RepID=UPI0021859580|nr:hypothetical protein [Cytobacillus pseudoceanisediminis]UQX56152.1 hypothetical protein M5V91_11285 [Cytobacillus pseudoceanisediminis]
MNEKKQAIYCFALNVAFLGQSHHTLWKLTLSKGLTGFIAVTVEIDQSFQDT